MILALCTLSISVWAQRKTQVVEAPVQESKNEGMVLKRKVAIGRFYKRATGEAFGGPKYLTGVTYDYVSFATSEQTVVVKLGEDTIKVVVK